MKITIDASSSLPPRTGIGNYTLQLIRNLLRLDTVNQYNLFANSLRRPMPELRQFASEHSNAHVKHYRMPGPWLHRLWQHVGFPSLDSLAGTADLVHAPATILPPVRHGKLLVTLNDCYFMRHPESCHALGGLYMRATVPKRIAECAAVLCISEFTRNEALELLPVNPATLHVVPLGVGLDVFRPIADAQAYDRVRRRYGLPHEFLMSVATLEPRKNLAGLFRAMARLRDIMGDIPPLVCVGGAGFGTGDLARLVSDLGIEGRVILPGYVDHEELPILYNMASAVVVPSLYEGFGLPVLEALACGAPVVASDLAVFREVGGDAVAAYANVEPEAMAHAIAKVLGSESIRAEARERGIHRAAGFSWQETARRTLAIYEAVGRES